MKNIKDYDIKELKEQLVSLDERPYRAEQIFKWLYKENVISFESMTDISKDLRQKLSKEYSLCNFNILEKQVSKDGTVKYLFDILDRKCNRNCTYGI